jgi:hypothetical protein
VTVKACRAYRVDVPVLGLVFVALGTLHFMQRDHRPTTRSMYVGGAGLSYRARVASAAIEVVFGLGVLFFSR